EKNKAESGTLAYYDFKLQMVSFIGKFAERSEQYDFSFIQEVMWTSGMSMEMAQDTWRKPATRKAFSSKIKVGKAWWPEAASLILGKARSITAQAVYNGCYHVSTDGGFFPKESVDKALSLDVIKQMQGIGSGFRPEIPKE